MLIYVNFKQDEKPTGEGFISGVGITEVKIESESSVLLADGTISETTSSAAEFVERGLEGQEESVTLGFSQRFDQAEPFCLDVINKINEVVEVKSPTSEFNILWGHSLEEVRKVIISGEGIVGYFIS